MARFEGGGGGGGYDPTAIHKPSGSATPGNLVEWAVNKTVVDSNLSTQTIEDTFTDLQANKADDVDVVHLAGVETITGQKTFTQHPHAPTPNNSDNTTHIATTAFVQSVASAKIEDQIQNNVTDKAPSQNAVFDALALKANDNQVVHLSGAETISGVKTFSSYPEKSATYTAPTTDLQLVPKKWVDDNKMPKQPTAVNNNVAMFNANGELIDSGKPATLLGTIGDGEVNTFAELPAASTKNGEIWLVKTTTGVIYVNRKVAGLYVSNGTSWNLITPIDVDGYQKLIASAIANNLVKMDANGQVQDTGVALSTLTGTNTFDRWVDNVIGSDLFTSNSKLFPFATIGKALTGAQYPLKVHLVGQSYTENIALSSSQSNVTIGAEFCAQSGLQTEFNGTITTSSGFTRLRLLNLTLNSGASTPITLASGDIGRHVIDNVSLQTTNASLISIPTNFQNWIDIVGVDVSGAPSSVLQLPTLVGTTATLTIKRLKGVLNISVGANSGWTIYLDSDCVVNWVGGYNNTPVFYTGQPKIDAISVITNQATLTALLASASGIGLYAINFSSPTGLTGLAQGDIIYHAGANSNAIFYPFALAPNVINVVAAGTYSKTSNGWELISNQLQIRQLIRTQAVLDSVISGGTLGNFIVGFASPSHAQLSGLAIGDIIQVSGVNSTRILSTFANAPQVVFCNAAGTNSGAYIKTGDPIHRWKLESGVATFSNANYSIPNFSGLTVFQIGTMSAERIVSLPASSSTPTTNTTIKIIDLSGTVSATNRIRLNPAGTDKINGVNAPIYINVPFGEVELVFNGTDGWVITDASLAVKVISYKTAGSYTYTPDPNLIFAIIKLVGGGGAGGTAPTTGATTRSCSSGGGAGATIEAILYPSDIGANKTVVVGAGGVAASTPTAATASTFGSTILVAGAGATGGTSSGTVCATGSSAGGTFSTTLPDTQIISQSNGGRGGNSFCNSTPLFFAGAGGISSMSGGAPSGLSNNDYTPLDAVGYGGGGRGSVNDLSSVARIGGNGSDGIVIITEYVRR